MADETGNTEPQPASSMQESWVDVEQQEGTLVHSRSKEELEKLLASAASEEEMSDSETMYQVTFKPSSITPEQEEEEEEEEPSLQVQVPTITQTTTERLATEQLRESERTTSTQTTTSTCSKLLLCVPVFILTHLAIFGIGYYLGKRMSVEPTIKLLHV